MQLTCDHDIFMCMRYLRAKYYSVFLSIFKVLHHSSFIHPFLPSSLPSFLSLTHVFIYSAFFSRNTTMSEHLTLTTITGTLGAYQVVKW